MEHSIDEWNNEPFAKTQSLSNFDIISDRNAEKTQTLDVEDPLSREALQGHDAQNKKSSSSVGYTVKSCFFYEILHYWNRELPTSND